MKHHRSDLKCLKILSLFRLLLLSNFLGRQPNFPTEKCCLMSYCRSLSLLWRCRPDDRLETSESDILCEYHFKHRIDLGWAKTRTSLRLCSSSLVQSLTPFQRFSACCCSILESNKRLRKVSADFNHWLQRLLDSASWARLCCKCLESDTNFWDQYRSSSSRAAALVIFLYTYYGNGI